MRAEYRSGSDQDRIPDDHDDHDNHVYHDHHDHHDLRGEKWES